MLSQGDVRFGSKADMCSAKGHVRFTPRSGHWRCTNQCPLGANSGHSRINLRKQKDPPKSSPIFLMDQATAANLIARKRGLAAIFPKNPSVVLIRRPLVAFRRRTPIRHVRLAPVFTRRKPPCAALPRASSAGRCQPSATPHVPSVNGPQDTGQPR